MLFPDCRYDTDYRYLKAGSLEMVIRRYVSFADLNRRLVPSSKERRSSVVLKGREQVKRDSMRANSAIPLVDGETERAAEETIDFTAMPKVSSVSEGLR